MYTARWSQPHNFFKVSSLIWLQLWNSGQNIHSKDWGEGKEPPVAWVKFSGQLEVTSSQQPPQPQGSLCCSLMYPEYLEQEKVNFSVKSHIAHIFSFLGHTVSVATTQLCLYNLKEDTAKANECDCVQENFIMDIET